MHKEPPGHSPRAAARQDGPTRRRSYNRVAAGGRDGAAGWRIAAHGLGGSLFEDALDLRLGVPDGHLGRPLDEEVELALPIWQRLPRGQEEALGRDRRPRQLVDLLHGLPMRYLQGQQKRMSPLEFIIKML